jgi:hypothetical protein
MLYEFRFSVKGGGASVSERGEYASDPKARTRAAAELLRMPSRTGVEVWQGDRLVYAHDR